MRMPFTWPQFERATGRPLPDEAKGRIRKAVNRPSRASWEAARSIVVAPQMSYAGQTLWQCVQAVTLRLWPDGTVPDSTTIVQALCYAAGIPFRW